MQVASQIDISKALAINGWMSEEELVWLATQALECQQIVEFGCFHGRSTRALGDHCNRVVWAVDPWAGDYATETGEILGQVNTFCMPQFMENLKDLIRIGRVIPVRAFSTSFRLPHKVDMVFIDGDHRYNTVVKDIHKALDLLNEGGIISGHDYGHPLWTGVKKAVDELLGPVEVVDTIWHTLKKTT